MHHETALHTLRETLDALRDKRLATPAFCALWRSQHALLTALPPRYREVMEDLLGRIESGSLFGEESCSFSQEDLRNALADWLDKAGRRLAA